MEHKIYYHQIESAAMALFLIRYGEMALKSARTRKRFGKILVENMEGAFVKNKVECIIREEWGRIFIDTNNADIATGILRHMFGIVSFSQVHRVKTERSAISKEAVNILKGIVEGKKTFAVRCRRKGTHDFSSQEMAAWVGEDILEAFQGLSVNLGGPDITVEVEIRDSRAYLFLDRINGPGGFPLGSQGSVVGLIEDGDLQRTNEVMMAFYLLMKRGCRVRPICAFDMKEVKDLEIELNKLDPRMELEFIPLAIGEDKSVDNGLLHNRPLVSARGLEQGLLRSDRPVFYPLIALPDNVLEKYRNAMG